jgi:hypothetical protein
MVMDMKFMRTKRKIKECTNKFNGYKNNAMKRKMLDYTGLHMAHRILL